MSFSKAKIQRFNEFENDVPPPGAYDPKFDDKIKGLAINKSERFHDKTINNSDQCLSLSNKSVNKTPVIFKTPQPVQKGTLSKSCSKIRPRSILPSTDTKSNPNIEREFGNLQIECLNKDKIIEEYVKRTQDMQENIKEFIKRSQEMQETIQEHVKCTQDMEENIQKLESQLEEMNKSHAKTEIQHKNDIETMAKLQKEVLDKHIKRHKSELEYLQKQLQEARAEKTHEIQAGKDIENDLRSRISGLLEKIDKLEFELTNQKHISEDKIQSLEKQNEENLHALNEASTKIEELTDTIRIMREKGSDTKENTEVLEEEKARREALEEEVRNLQEYIAQLKKDYEEISEKYAESIGHQNHKQRIKHVSQLKDKINQLEEDIRMKAKKIEQQRKIIEKMNSEEKRIPNKFKENFLKSMKDETEGRTLETSPMKACSPLRTIND